MNSELETIRDAWDKDTGAGREEARTREMCDAYVTSHPEQFMSLRDMTLEDCVTAVGVFRQAVMEEEQWKVEVWLLHRFLPQQIGAQLQAQIRIPGVNDRLAGG